MTKKLSTKQDIAKPMEIAGEVMKLEQLKKQVDERLREYKRQLLEKMLELDVVQLKTGDYTLSRKQYKRVKVTNDEQATRDLEKMGVPVETKTVLDMNLMKIPLRNLLDEGKEIEGVEEVKTDYVSVRLAKKGDK